MLVGFGIQLLQGMKTSIGMHILALQKRGMDETLLIGLC